MNTHTTISAAQKYPGCLDRLRKDGKRSIARMAELLESPRAIDKALGYESAASHWLAGRNGISSAAERAAALWLAVNDTPQATTPSKTDGRLFLVVTDDTNADKIKRVLTMLGAEVEEV